jgi:hypothetical protein
VPVRRARHRVIMREQCELFPGHPSVCLDSADLRPQMDVGDFNEMAPARG